ncbi:MAG: site-specific DNA-methyltransferase, partial [Gammaproteobacteria bacterium]|nr:site-specific DNA-methyltransferase [Gammaproteobacteria bacterium]
MGNKRDSNYLIKGRTPVWSSFNNNAVLYRGDALDSLRQIPNDSVDCIWTDPPYNLSNDGITCIAGRMVPVNKGEWDRSRGIEGDYQFNLAWTKECFRILRPTGSIWVTGTLHVHSSVGMALQRNGFRLLNDIVWEKTNPPPNLGRRTFTHSTELIFWASKSQKNDRIKYKFNYEKMKEMNGGKQMKTVWKMGGPKSKEKSFGKHPTQKPVDLIQRCLIACTDIGDVVIDPFAGSSSTGVAALMIDRRFLGIDNNEEFIELSIKRLQDLSPCTINWYLITYHCYTFK